MSRFDRQTPSGDEIYLDHVGWFIPDVEHGSRMFERLGFMLTPFVVSRNADPGGGPPKPSGTGNRCAMLRRGYLELIAAIDGINTPLAQQHRAAVSRHVGVHVIAFTVADAGRAHARLQAEGFEPGDPVRLRRPIRAPDGSDTFAAFTVIRVAPERMPEGRIQILTQETPDSVWQSNLIARDNGISALSGALLSVDDPGKVAARYSRFLGKTPAGNDDYCVFDLDRGHLAIASPERCREVLRGNPLPDPPVVAAVTFAADDPDATERFLVGRGVPFSKLGNDTLQIGAADGLGAALIVHQAQNGWALASTL